MASPEGLRLAPWLAQRRRVRPDDLVAKSGGGQPPFVRTWASRGEREFVRRALTLTRPASFIGFNGILPPQVASVNSV